MADVVITVEYLGVVRLLLGRREDRFAFGRPPSVGEVVAAVGTRYGGPAAAECRRQLFVLYRPGESAGETVDDTAILADGSLLKIASPVTGG